MEFEVDDLEQEIKEKKIEAHNLTPEKPSIDAKTYKEENILTSSYNDYEFSEEEMKNAEELSGMLGDFLKKKCDLVPGKPMSTTPTGVDLFDALAGGGVATSLVQFVGPSGCGKSSFAANILSTSQRRWPGKSISMYIDSEQTMTKERLGQLGVIYPKIDPYPSNTVEAIFKAVEGICAFKEEHPECLDVPSIVVWDSIASTMTEKGKVEDNHNSVLGLRAQLLSFFLPRYAEKLNNYNISLVSVNQLRDKIEVGYGHSIPDLRMLADKKIPGGQSLLFHSAQIVYMRQSKILKDEYGFSGCEVLCKFVKNKLFTPNIEFTMLFSFEHGFSNFWTNYELLKKFKYLTAGAGRVKLKNYKNKSSFFQKQTPKIYKEDENFRKAWHDAVQEILQTEIIEKYKTDEKNKDADLEIHDDNND